MANYQSPASGRRLPMGIEGLERQVAELTKRVYQIEQRLGIPARRAGKEAAAAPARRGGPPTSGRAKAGGRMVARPGRAPTSACTAATTPARPSSVAHAAAISRAGDRACGAAFDA